MVREIVSVLLNRKDTSTLKAIWCGGSWGVRGIVGNLPLGLGLLLAWLLS